MIYRKDKGKVLKMHVLKDLVPRSFDARIGEIQEEHRQAIQEWDNQIQVFQYENVELQVEFWTRDH